MLFGNMTNVTKNIEQNTLKDLDNFLNKSMNCKSNARIKGENVYEEANKIFCGEEGSKTLDDFIHWLKYGNLDNTLIGTSCSWRTMNQNVINDNAYIIRKVLNKGLGVINGGALGGDWISNEIVLKEGDPSNQLRIVLPVNRFAYMERFYNVLEKKVVNRTQADSLVNQLKYIDKNFPWIIFDKTHFDEKKFLESENDEYRKNCYHFRDGLIAYGCDGLVALWINASNGVGDTIRKTKYMKKPLITMNYTIDPNSEENIKDYESLIIPNLRADYPLEDKSSSIQTRSI